MRDARKKLVEEILASSRETLVSEKYEKQQIKNIISKLQRRLHWIEPSIQELAMFKELHPEILYNILIQTIIQKYMIVI